MSDAGVDLSSLKNDIQGTVRDTNGPVQGATVTVVDGTATATTDASGAFTLAGLPLGAYSLSVHLDGYVDQVVDVFVNLSGPTKVTVALSLVAAGDAGTTVPGAGPTVTTGDQLLAGFGTTVTLRATAQGTGPFTYAWTQPGGPTVTLQGADTATPSFTTQDLPTSLGPSTAANARFGVLGLNPDQAGVYSFSVTVTDALGRSTKATAVVNSTRPTTGLRNVPIGVPVWLQGDGAIMANTAPAPTDGGAPATVQTSWNWTLDVTGAAGSKSVLANPTSQYPSFTPDIVGTYVLRETVSQQTLNVYAGTWVGEMDTPAPNASQALCMGCHTNPMIPAPDKFTPWKKTKHYSALQRKLDGVAGPGFSEGCLPCHTVGYDQTASNNGFDDVEAATGWQFPAKLQTGNWATLDAVPGLGQLAGIQCENCHGPQKATSTGAHPNPAPDVLGSRISWATEVCASCHQENPHHYKPSQWVLGKHSDRTLALKEATVEGMATNAAHCGRCHSAQGFAKYAAQLKNGVTDYITQDGKPRDPSGSNASTIASLSAIGLTRATVEAQTCSACHDPHDATNPSQLRLYDSVAALPNGLTNISGAGTGMVCIACHNSRNGEHTDFASPALTSFSAPHSASQVDAVYGFNAYFINRLTPSPHLAVANTCAGCHYAVTTASVAAAKQTSNHSFVVDNTVCANCHSANVDGAGLEASFDMDLAMLESLFASKTLAPISAAINPTTGATIVVRAYEPTLQLYSSKSSGSVSNVVIAAAPKSVDFTLIGTNTAGLVLHLPSAVSIQWVDTSGNPVGSPVSVSDVTVPLSSVKVSSTTTVFAAPTADPNAVQVLYKAYWNMYLLLNDKTHGVHNPPFYRSVIAGTSAALKALP